MIPWRKLAAAMSLLLMLVLGCGDGDDDGPRHLGESCYNNEQCESGYCYCVSACRLGCCAAPPTQAVVCDTGCINIDCEDFPR